MTVYNLQLVVNLNNNQIKSPNVFAVFFYVTQIFMLISQWKLVMLQHHI